MADLNEFGGDGAAHPTGAENGNIHDFPFGFAGERKLPTCQSSRTHALYQSWLTRQAGSILCPGHGLENMKAEDGPVRASLNIIGGTPSSPR
jgi:hypothetical protein